MPEPGLYKLYSDLEKTVTELSQWVGRPLLLEDEHFRLVTYSPHADIQGVDWARWGTVLSKRVPAKVLQAMHREGIVRMLQQGSGAIRVKAIPEVGFQARVAVPIRHGNRILGYLWLLDSDTISDDVLERFAEVAEAELRKAMLALHKELEDHRDNDVVLLRDLARGTAVDPARLARIREKAFSSACRHFWLAAIVRPGFPTDDWRLPAAIAARGQNWKVQAVTFEVGAVCCVVCGVPYAAPPEAEPNILGFLEALREDFRRETRQVGIGVHGPFPELAEVREAAPAAHGAALVSSHLLDGAAVACSCQFPAFVSALRAWRGSDEPPWAESRAAGSSRDWYAILEDYDSRQKSSLLATLAAYLESGGSSSKASAVLHVHPNTLLYRLQRIEQLTGFDLEDGRQRLLLHFELQARRLWTALRAASAPQDESPSPRAPLS